MSWWCYTLARDINEKGIVLNVIPRSIVQMDAVAEFYSKPQVGGSLKAGSSRRDNYSKYAIPIFRGNKERVGQAAQGVAEAVSMAGGAAVKKFVREAPLTGKKRKLHAGANKLRQRMSNSSTGVMARTLDEDDEGKPIESKKKRKHKRNKIDDVLGDDSY